MKTSEVLERAADYIIGHGWCQYGLEEPNGKVCAVGALRRAGGYAPMKTLSSDSPVDRAAYAMDMAVGTYAAEWNDAPERMQDEVVAMLRAVAATERAREATDERVVERNTTDITVSA